jgi:hypothetical protein
MHAHSTRALGLACSVSLSSVARFRALNRLPSRRAVSRVEKYRDKYFSFFFENQPRAARQPCRNFLQISAGGPSCVAVESAELG